MPVVFPDSGLRKANSPIGANRSGCFVCGGAARAYRCVSIMYIWITTSGENVNGTQP